MKRVELSWTFESALNDPEISAELLFQLLHACERCYAHLIVIETTKLPDHDRDPVARGVSTSELKEILETLEKAARIARRGPALYAQNAGKDTPPDWPFLDEGCADRIEELSKFYHGLIEHRSEAEEGRARGSRPEGPVFSQPPPQETPLEATDVSIRPATARPSRKPGATMRPETLLAVLVEPRFVSLGWHWSDALGVVASLSGEILDVEITELTLRNRLQALKQAERSKAASRKK